MRPSLPLAYLWLKNSSSSSSSLWRHNHPWVSTNWAWHTFMTESCVNTINHTIAIFVSPDVAEGTQTFVSSCAFAKLSTAMAKKTFSSVSVMTEVREQGRPKQWAAPDTHVDEEADCTAPHCWLQASQLQHSVTILIAHTLWAMLNYFLVSSSWYSTVVKVNEPCSAEIT